MSLLIAKIAHSENSVIHSLGITQLDIISYRMEVIKLVTVKEFNF